MGSKAVAAYLPESMLIRIGPDLRILNAQGMPEPFPTAQAFGWFFHEYAHYLHNISTASGIAAFINTLELWRCFRVTVDLAAYSADSYAFAPKDKDHLARLLAYLDAARRNHKPKLRMIHTPVLLTVSSYLTEVDVEGADGQPLLTTVVCQSEVRDQGGQTEQVTSRLGTLELLEGAAWLLEKRMVEAVNANETAQSPPIFPYRVAEALAARAVPGLPEEAVLACILASLQSSDAPAAFVEVLGIAGEALSDRKDPVAVLRERARAVAVQNEEQLERTFASLEAEFNGNGVMATAVRRIVGAARTSCAARRDDPFFEVDTIRILGSGNETVDQVLQRMPSCAIMQHNYGSFDAIGRDYLLSFLPISTPVEGDPESGLRIIHSLFDYVNRHRKPIHLASTGNAARGACPFYTCCSLALRQTEPEVCRRTPWEAADWSGWDEAKGTCWYGAGVRITRPPTGEGGEHRTAG